MMFCGGAVIPQKHKDRVIEPLAQIDRLSQLLARSGLGDRKAFAELYKLASPKLFSMAIRILKRRDWAEEILQEGFVSIWQHASDYSAGKAAPMTWMATIIRNRALDLLRRPNVEVTLEEESNVVELWEDQQPGPAEALFSSREAAQLQRCIDQLEGKQRQTIMLAYHHCLTHEQLAQQLDQPLGTIKSWIRRGLERIKNCLGQ